MSRLLFALAVCALGAMSAPAVAEDFDEAAAQIRSAWEQRQSVSATLRIEAAPPIGSTRVVMGGDGTVQALRVDGVEKYKTQAKYSFGQPMTASMQVECVFDGKSLQVTNDALGRRGSRTVEPDLYRGAVPPGGGLLLDARAADMTLERLTDSDLGGTAVFVIEGKAKDKSSPVSRLQAWIAKDTGALLKLELYESDAVLTVRLLLSEVEWDLELDPALFELSTTADTLAPAQN